MSGADERDAFERMVDRVLAYRPKKSEKKRKKKREAKARKSAKQE
jgi:hypothetical protein